tara:strand:- start:448 stop:696 length:249 start_codon:yes stop_codon:yes gene_type:complete
MVLLINSGEDSMKIGDLIQLSSYGEARNHNWDFWGGFGIITKVHGPSSKYPIHAYWYGKCGKEIDMATFHPREIKKYKPVKN